MKNPPSADISLSDSGSLLLHLPVESYAFSQAQTLQLGDWQLRKKPELHVTLLDADAVEHICQNMQSEHLLATARAMDWQIARTGKGSLLVCNDQDTVRQSVVEWIDLAAFSTLRAQLRQQSGVALSETLPHITQYASDDKGIGLPDLATIERLKQADLRLPGICDRAPRTTRAEAKKSFEDGSSLLPPDVIVRLGQRNAAIDPWLEQHAATSALLFSAADPYDQPASPRGNAVRWALLDAELDRMGIASVAVLGKEEDDEPTRISLCLLNIDAASSDALLRRYEQVAAVRVSLASAPALILHPALREDENE